MDARDAGTLTLAGHEVPRMGFGAMRLPGPEVWGPPADRDRAVAVCRRAVELGVRVVDTAWFYGDLDHAVSDEILAEALRPYPEDLLLVTKLGGRRTADKGWAPGLRPEMLREGCETDLRTLGVDRVPVAHLRWLDVPSAEGWAPFSEALGTMLELRDEGKIGAIGLSTVSVDQIEQTRALTDVACVSNAYSPLDRSDEAVVTYCDTHGIPYLPYFPLAVGRVADPGAIGDVAADLGHAPVQVALAWLLQRSPWMLPIPGTGNPEHVEQNVGAAAITLPDEALARLDAAADPDGATPGH